MKTKSKKPKLNWNPVLGSLLKTLQDHKFRLVSFMEASTAETPPVLIYLEGTIREQRQTTKQLIREARSCDLFVQHTSARRHLLLSIHLDGAQRPEDLVSYHDGNEVLQLALMIYRNKWRHRKVPTI